MKSFIKSHTRFGDKMSVVVQCVFCRKLHNFSCNYEGFLKWMHGDYIQHALPDLDKDKREMLISGVCPSCWDIMFGDNE